MVVNAFLPAIPFLHSGYEIAERFPINTGLDFTDEELKKFPSETLPLFSEYAYNWCNKEQFSPWIGQVLRIRKKYEDLVVDPHPASFRVLHDANQNIQAFARVSEKPKRHLAVVGNADCLHRHTTSTKIETRKEDVVDLLTGNSYAVQEGHIHVSLDPGHCVVFEY
jgi:starch synthase (maltosyl-transferring)